MPNETIEQTAKRHALEQTGTTLFDKELAFQAAIHQHVDPLIKHLADMRFLVLQHHTEETMKDELDSCPICKQEANKAILDGVQQSLNP